MKPAERAGKIDELYDRIQRDPKYRNARMGEVFVPGRGALGGNPIVFIGEAPGRDEEKERKPFVGLAGKNLSSLLREIGLSQDNVHITNLLKYRPFAANGENRSPTPGERRYCLPYLIEELEILAPRLAVCLGLSSAKALLDDLGLKMAEANGKLFERNGLKVFVTYHPSPFNYRMPGKREALRKAFQRMRELHSRMA
jgi:uracil-DNA glycosylase